MENEHGLTPEELNEQIEKIRQGLEASIAGDLPEGFAVEVVNAADPMTAFDTLKQLMQLVGPTKTMQAAVHVAADNIVMHQVLEPECKCTVEDNWERLFGIMDDAYELAKAAVRPDIQEAVDKGRFEREAMMGLEDLDVMDESARSLSASNIIIDDALQALFGTQA